MANFGLFFALIFPYLVHQVVGQNCGTHALSREYFCIEDDAKKGFLLGSVIGQKRMKSIFGDQWNKATFDFLETNQAVLPFFTIDPRKGRLSLARDIDRDTLCPEAKVCCNVDIECRLDVKIVVNVPQERVPHIENIVVTIFDKNDHAPKFPHRQEVLHISENARRGTEIRLPLAVDPDALQYSVQSYQIANGNLPSVFLLETRNHPIRPGGSRIRQVSQVFLKLDRPLDRETKANYSFVLVALDGGRPAFSGSTSILVMVEDHNDNGPKFTKSSYDVDVEEGQAPLRRPLLRLEAHDPDAGSNAITRYAFAETVSPEVRQMFEISAGTGEIFLRKPLDYEQASLHKFAVIAVDQGGHSDTATASVTIRVRDLNDERPQITLAFVASPSGKKLNKGDNNKVARIEENGGPRKFVAIVQVVDKDLGENGHVNCSLGNHQNDFQLELRTRQEKGELYMIYASHSLDRERTPSIDLLIRCQDRGRPVSQSASMTLTVKLVDKNDNVPRLMISGEPGRTVEISENRPANTKVVRVHGVDTDEGPNGQLTFSMEQSDRLTQSLFQIDPNDGWVTTRVEIDRESTDPPINQLPLIVTACDHGVKPHTSTLSVNINIIDINDNAPVFTDNPMYFNLRENEPAKYRVGEIRLMDKDVNSHIVVRLDYAKNSNSVPFLIYKEAGKFYINTTQRLDREVKAEYTFHIQAVDNTDTGSHTTPGTVHVTVEDVNDNTPQIIFPRLDNKTISLSYREQKGFEVLTVNANDKDKSDESGKCYFEVTPASTDILEIDPQEGIIRVRRPITEADIGAHKVGVIVRDNGHPPRHSVVSFTLVVDRSKPHRQHREVFVPPRYRPSFTWRSDITLIIVLALIICLLIGIVILIIYVRHWRQAFLFLPDLLSPCHRRGRKRRRQEEAVAAAVGNVAKDADSAVHDKFLYGDASMARSHVDMKVRHQFGRSEMS